MNTSAQYTKAIQGLAPQGFILPQVADDSELGKLWATIGDSMLAVDDSATDTNNEMFPDVIGSFLSEWYSIIGFPRCGIAVSTQAAKRDAILSWLNISAFSTKAFFVAIAATLGFTIIVEDKNDDPALGAFEFRVTSSAVAPISYFHAGQNRAGDYLVTQGTNDALVCLIKFFAPAHTTPIFVYV